MAETHGKRPFRHPGSAFQDDGSELASPAAFPSHNGAGRAVVTPSTIEFPFCATDLSCDAEEFQAAGEGADRRAWSDRRNNTLPMQQPSVATPMPSAEAQSDHPTATDVLATLLRRLEKMLMGGGGSPVRSGEEKMADTLSPLLVYYIDDAARKLFEKHSLSGVQKSAGIVDQEEARAYLAIDALGEPLLPVKVISSSGRELGRQFGESLRQAAARLEKKVKAGIKAAGRIKGGPTKDAVAAKVLEGQPVCEITILSECIAAARAPPPRSRKRPAEPSPQPPAVDPAPSKPASKHGPMSQRSRAQAARLRDSKTAARRRHINSRCSCANFGEPYHNESAGEKSRDFVNHHIFCQMWHCYAFEIGSCEPKYIFRQDADTREQVAIELEPCDCLGDAFDEEHLCDNDNRRYVRGHVDEYGEMDRPGPRGVRCYCCGDSGRYVPLCKYRRNAASGELRGDEVYAARGEPWGEWRGDSTCPW